MGEGSPCWPPVRVWGRWNQYYEDSLKTDYKKLNEQYKGREEELLKNDPSKLEEAVLGDEASIQRLLKEIKQQKLDK